MGPDTPYIMTTNETARLMDYCKLRFEKYSQPCKSCRYRSDGRSIYNTCMFINCPRDWEIEK